MPAAASLITVASRSCAQAWLSFRNVAPAMLLGKQHQLLISQAYGRQRSGSPSFT